MERFRDQLWAGIEAKLWPAICQHPFVAGLTTGQLPHAAFRYYVVQDSLYLREFGRGLSLLASRAESSDGLLMFCEHAKATVIVERALHEGFMQDLKVTEEEIASTSPAPTTMLYTSCLLRQAYGAPLLEAFASFLPCYWVYWEVGKYLVSKGSPDCLYQRWIDAYAGEEFATTVRDFLDLIDETASRASEGERQAATRAFREGVRFEWMFWEMAWREEQWPLGTES